MDQPASATAMQDLQAVIAKLQKAAAAQGVLVAELRMQSSAARKDAARQQQLLLASQSTIRCEASATVEMQGPEGMADQCLFTYIQL